MNTLSPLRWPRLLATAGAFATCASLGVFLRPTARPPTLPEMERQLQLALDAHAVASVREMSHRISAVDTTAERQLALAELFLRLGLHEEVDRALTAAAKASPTPRPVIEKIRARSAAARGEWALAVGHWGAYLQTPPAAEAAERAAALDEVADALIRQHTWQQARARLDERLALADSPHARVRRGTVLTRLRQWERAKEDFAQLARVAADDGEAKPLLPRWERVERAMAELTARDAAVDEAPTSLAPRLDRGWTALQAGLTQNAAEDFVVAMRVYPLSRMALLLLATGTAVHDFDPRLAEDPNALTDAAEILAPSDTLGARNAFLTPLREDWMALRDCDLAIATTTTEGPELLARRTEQARLVARLGHPQRALEDARSLLHSAPDYLPAQKVEIAALATLKRWVEAETAIASVVSRETAEGLATDFEFDRLAGIVWQAQGKHLAATERFLRCLARERTPEILRARAKSLRFLQRFDEASEDLAEAQALEAADPVLRVEVLP